MIEKKIGATIPAMDDAQLAFADLPEVPRLRRGDRAAWHHPLMGTCVGRIVGVYPRGYTARRDGMSPRSKPHFLSLAQPWRVPEDTPEIQPERRYCFQCEWEGVGWWMQNERKVCPACRAPTGACAVPDTEPVLARIGP